MIAILAKKKIKIGDVEIEIRELSALQYLDQQEYMAGLDRPEEGTEGMAQQELNQLSRAWARLTLNGQSRLVAYSFAEACDDIDSLQFQVQQSYTFEVIKQLHDEIAVLSGFNLGGDEELSEEGSEVSGDANSDESLGVEDSPK